MIRIWMTSLFNFLFDRLKADRRGNFSLFAAVTMCAVVLGVGGSIDLHSAYAERERMQQSLDAGVLAAVRKSNLADQRDEIQKVFLANYHGEGVDFDRNLSVVQNPDKSITATMRILMKTTFMEFAGVRGVSIAVKASAIATNGGPAGPCIRVLGSSGQDVLINSGANVLSNKCAIDVASTANPAFIMSSDSMINFTSFCVKGTQYIKNGGTLANLKTGCATQADPYAGTLPEPAVPGSCTTSGAMDGSTISLSPGVHCGTTFNGSPTITFKPGLHIIKGRMIINAGATVTARDVTFYFPDTNSEIRANGGLTFTATAPTSGPYKGLLMFEKTSDKTNNGNKTQYIFDGSNGETLEGIIYLPNRNVVYNSTTNVAAKLSMVVNQMTFGTANWRVEPYDGAGAASAGGVRLTE